jgi:hypothetical protein
MLNKYIFSIIFSILLISCGKNSGNSNGSTSVIPEENIVFSINPDPGTSIQAVLGITHTIIVLISSKLPNAGVVLSWKIVQDSNQSSILEEKNISTIIPKTDIVTPLLTPGILYSCSITITSKSKPSNTATKTFKLARK